MGDSGVVQSKTLVLTVGLPRCGKTTWAQTKGCPIVSPDAIRLALHGAAFISDAEAMVWAIAKYMVKSLFLAGHTMVILDATSTTRVRRDEWRSDSWQRRYKVFSTSIEECKRRAQETPALLPVIDRMAVQFEPLSEEEWDDLYRDTQEVAVAE